MPTTPGITITDQPTWDRVFAAFNGSQAEYLKWLRTALKEEVTRRELASLEKAQADARAQRINELRDAIDPTPIPPPAPSP